MAALAGPSKRNVMEMAENQVSDLRCFYTTILQEIQAVRFKLDAIIHLIKIEKDFSGANKSILHRMQHQKEKELKFYNNVKCSFEMNNPELKQIMYPSG